MRVAVTRVTRNIRVQGLVMKGPPGEVDTSENFKGVVVHGAVSDTARPSGFISIEWIGSVEPENAINNDTWIDTS